MSSFISKLEDVGSLRIMSIFFKSLAVTVTFLSSLFKHSIRFAITQDISIVPMIFGCFILENEVKGTAISHRNYFYTCFIINLFLAILISINTVGTAVKPFNLIIAHVDLRKILLFVELSYIIIVEYCKYKFSKFIDNKI